MPKAKTTKKAKPEVKVTTCEKCEKGDFCEIVGVPAKPKIGELGETFGNGDLNILRDKINEIIKHINN